MTGSRSHIPDTELYVAWHYEDWAYGTKRVASKEGLPTVDCDLWRETIAWFGAAGMLVIRGDRSLPLNARKKTDILPPVRVHEFWELTDAYYVFSDFTWVFFDPCGTQCLSEFEHPTGRVVYAFGPDGQGFKPNVRDAVRIPAVRDVGSMWAVSAATVALYDRMIKGGS
jgi:hypothetical protein